MATSKVTISLDSDELLWMMERARRDHGGNLSAAFVDGVHVLRRSEALRDFLRMSKAPALSSDKIADVLAEIRGVSAPKRRSTRARRAA